MLLLIIVIATWFMTGLIWFVQAVHYPLMAEVGDEPFQSYHRQHTRLKTFVVVWPMTMELMTAVGLVAFRPSLIPAWAAWTGLLAVILIWATTGLLQVPSHNRLGRSFDRAKVSRLVRGNWIRTSLWTGRALLLAWLLHR